MTAPVSYHIGCPVWTCRDWIGSVFDRNIEPNESLREYAKIFNTVEANSVFYAIPPSSNLERWMAQTGPGFQFCPKFPKAISHERRLVDAKEETNSFLKVLEVLDHGERLGPSFLQLPPSFNSNSFKVLESYLESLPSNFRYVVEPRHVTWYDKSENEQMLNDLLQRLGMDKVVFDSRPLFTSEPADKDEVAAQSRKPQTPVRKSVLGQYPFLRLVGKNDPSSNKPWLKEWAPIINKWILDGKKPFIFTHCPNEANAPYLARALHEQLKKLNPLLEPFSNFASDSKKVVENQEQLDFFDA